MQCPVCPNANIPPDQTSCANCGADLTPIRRMQELPARWFNEALIALRAGDTSAAIAKLFSAAAIEPRSVPIRRVLGKALWNAGRTSEAHEQWRLIAEDDEEAKRLLAMPVARRNYAAIAAVVILALIAVGALIMALRPRSAGSVGGPPAVAAAAGRRSNPAGEPPAERRTSGPRYELASLESKLAARDDLRAEREGNGLRLTFREGLFPSGSDVPTPAGRARLESLARELAGTRVQVEGFTDSNPPPRGRWADNWSLAFARAHAAVNAMRVASGERVSWSATSSGDRQTPYPANQPNNRTVVLHVMPGE